MLVIGLSALGLEVQGPADDLFMILPTGSMRFALLSQPLLLLFCLSSVAPLTLVLAVSCFVAVVLFLV